MKRGVVVDKVVLSDEEHISVCEGCGGVYDKRDLFEVLRHSKYNQNCEQKSHGGLKESKL